jgi:hypothetical protein
MAKPAELIVLVLMALLSFCPGIWAQDTGASDPAALESMAREVYANVVLAAGEDREAPVLVVAKMPDASVALFDQERHCIMVEPKALSVCAGFGPEAPVAMAALLAHELAHFYLGHRWKADFGSDTGADVDIRLRTDAEAQADRQAGFYAYMAGYPTAGVFPRLLTALYKAYGLPDEMLGYLGLAIRRRQAAQAEALLKPAWWAYEGGKRLLLLDRPVDAILAFDRAAQDFPSREVLCGAALARMLAARESLGPERFPWVLPSLLDPHSRASTSEVALESEAAAGAQRQAWLQEAVDLLQKSKLKQPGYRPASLDLAGAYLLEGRLDAAQAEAKELAAKAAQAGDPRAALGAAVIQALCLAQDGKAVEAQRALEGLDASQDWVSRNLSLLRHESGDGASGPSLLQNPDESLGGWRPEERSTWTHAAWDWTQISPAQGESLNLYHSEGAGVYALRCVRGPDEDVVAVTRPSYGGQTARGVKLGSDLDALRKAYGSPLRSLPTDDGDYLFFKHIAFLVRGQKVAEWMLF